MLKMFAPSASTPPSANRKHCTINTVVSTTIAALGPSKAATSTPPTRCPDVPPATGKLTICAANRNAAASPSNGTRRGGSLRRTWRNASPTPAAESRAVVSGGLPINEPIRYVHDDTLPPVSQYQPRVSTARCAPSCLSRCLTLNDTVGGSKAERKAIRCLTAERHRRESGVHATKDRTKRRT